MRQQPIVGQPGGGITAHWLDPCSFECHSVALACRQLRGAHTFDALASALNDIHAEYEIGRKIVRTTTDNVTNFIKAFRVFGQPDENNNSDEEPKKKKKKVMHLMMKRYWNSSMWKPFWLKMMAFRIRPKHHRCACHFLNLVSTVNVTRANRSEVYEKLSRSAFSKCQALWDKAAKCNSTELLFYGPGTCGKNH